MKQSFYVYNNGDLKRKDNTLQFTNYDGEKRDIPIERISDIYVMSEMSFNTKFIDYISQYGIPMHFFNYYNFYTTLQLFHKKNIVQDFLMYNEFYPKHYKGK